MKVKEIPESLTKELKVLFTEYMEDIFSNDTDPDGLKDWKSLKEIPDHIALSVNSATSSVEASDKLNTGIDWLSVWGEQNLEFARGYFRAKSGSYDGATRIYNILTLASPSKYYKNLPKSQLKCSGHWDKEVENRKRVELYKKRNQKMMHEASL